MKKMVYVMMVFLLIGSLFISCSNETAATGDKLNAVRISVGSSRAVDYTVESDVPAVADLYWYYSAIKADAGLYNTGATDWAPIKLEEGKQINLFSQGDWTFCFYGYASAQTTKPDDPMLAAVYYSVNLSVTVNNADVYVDIPLTNGPGIENGKVFLEELSFTLPADIINGNAAGYFVLNVYRDGELVETSDEIPYSSTATSYAFEFDEDDDWYDEYATAGQHEYTFDVVFTYGTKTAVVASDSLSVTLDRGLKITFSGAVSYTDPLNNVIVGEITGQTKATAAIPASTAAAGVTVTSNVSPAGVDNPDAVATTAVQFAAGTIPAETGADYTLSTDVRGISATAAAAAAAEPTDDTFVVAEGNVPVASIDLTLTQTQGQTQAVVDLNPSGLVTVTTYVAKNLSNAVVYYDGAAFTLLSEGMIPAANTFTYDAETGKVVFYTNHFSTFVVGSTSVAVNVSTNLAYDSLPVAIADVDDEEEILLLKDYTNWIPINNGKKFKLNLGGKTLGSENFGLDLSNAFVTVANGILSGRQDMYVGPDASYAVGKYNKLVIEQNVVSGSICLFQNGTNALGYGSQIDIYGEIDGYVFVLGNIHEGNSVINVFDGAKITNGIHLNGFATVNVFEGANIEGSETAVEVRAGNLNIYGGSFVSNSNVVPVVADPNGSGSSIKGAALGIAQHTTNLAIRVNVWGGTFTGNAGLFEDNPEKNANLDIEINLIDGKFVSRLDDGYAIRIVDDSKVLTLSNAVRDAAVGQIYLGINKIGPVSVEPVVDGGDN